VVKFGADENFNLLIIKGLKRRKSDLDIILVQDVGLRTEDDPVLLSWAAEDGRVTLTHDIRTMPGFAVQRIETGQRMSGLIVVPDQMPIGPAIEDLLVIAECTESAEWESRIEYLPL
jgi:Domain of unknown function (DUF5615)